MFRPVVGHSMSGTLKPLLTGPSIKWTPSIKRTLSGVLKLTSYQVPL